MDIITRKNILYPSKVEYADHAVNHVRGCAHGCNYPCYAFENALKNGLCKNYDEWIHPRLVSNAEELLEADLALNEGSIKSVHFCFTTDPFMYGYPDVSDMTLKLMSIVNNHGIRCSVLTKGILPIEITELSPKNHIGISLVSLSEDFRKQYEPYSAPITDRIDALRKIHEKGGYTMISMEPYPTPNIINQDLGEVLNAIGFVDLIIFGKWNYNENVQGYKEARQFYNKSVVQVKEFCNANNIKYYIKNDTAAL